MVLVCICLEGIQRQLMSKFAPEQCTVYRAQEFHSALSLQEVYSTRRHSCIFSADAQLQAKYTTGRSVRVATNVRYVSSSTAHGACVAAFTNPLPCTNHSNPKPALQAQCHHIKQHYNRAAVCTSYSMSPAGMGEQSGQSKQSSNTRSVDVLVCFGAFGKHALPPC